MTVPMTATRSGLELIFSDWSMNDPVELYDMGGMAAIHKFYERADSRYQTNRGTPANAFPILAAYLISHGRLDDAYDVLMADETQKTPQQIQRLATAFEAKGQINKAIELLSHLNREYPGSDDISEKLAGLKAQVANRGPSD